MGPVGVPPVERIDRGEGEGGAGDGGVGRAVARARRVVAIVDDLT